ncbi:MAG: VanZ family protein [Burkholderiaceae bacterium]|nr:VanZ family protein [Burkholderiaceae bacterium]
MQKTSPSAPDAEPGNSAEGSGALGHSASAFARAGLLAYAMLIVYASWYPFSGWRDLGVPAFAYLWAPLPHYWTWFDVSINVLGYIPFGMFLVCAMYPHIRGPRAGLLSAVCGIFVSASMEAVQTFLPSRVASNLDLLTNGIGACIGAFAAVLLTPKLLQESRLLALRRRWFAPTASHGLIVLALWALAQIYPNEYMFGQGQMAPVVSDWLSQWLETAIDIGALLRMGHELNVEHYWLADAFITVCGMAGALALLLSMLRPVAPKLALAALLLAAALAVKAMASALFFGPENAFAWLTPGAQFGLLLGLPLTVGMAVLPWFWQRRLAAVLLAAGFIAVNAAPSNPYFIATLQTWVQGQFLNFDGAAQFLSLWWPLFALGFALWPLAQRPVAE